MNLRRIVRERVSLCLPLVLLLLATPCGLGQEANGKSPARAPVVSRQLFQGPASGVGGTPATVFRPCI